MERETERKALEWELQRLFETLLHQNPAYTQIRLIGAAGGGHELVRVNQIDGVVAAVPRSGLQPKGERYYFRETVGLPPGRIFISRVDLNREHGTIVVPHQPVLRIATPVIDDTNAIPAIVIVNIDLDVLLRGVAPLAEDGFVVLTNAAGDYLYHPDRSRTFGFEFGRPQRLPDDYGIAAAWRAWMTGTQPAGAAPFATPGWMLALDRVVLDEGRDRAGEGAPAMTLVLGAVVSQARIREQGGWVRDHLYLTLVLVCGGLAVAMGTATAFLTRPIRTLSEAANRIAAGEHDVRVPVQSRDEIGVLAGHFNEMLEALRESARTKELAALGRMAAMVAHDLRNALSSVKVNLQVLERQRANAGAAPDPRSAIALAQVQTMEDILRDLLTFARPDLLRPDWHELSEMVRTATTSLLPTAAEKAVSLNCDGLESLPRLWSDRTQIIRLFQNLIANAVEATSNGGAVRIAGRVVEGPAGHEVALEVADDGRGIPAEIVKDLFEPFFTTRTKGTGLGLAIVKRIVEEHGGRVALESRVGAGTRVTVRLPVRAGYGAEARESAPDGPVRTRERPLAARAAVGHGGESSIQEEGSR